MSAQPAVVTTSQLDVPRPVLWQHATTFAGIRAELWPWLTMTTPRVLRERRLDEIAPGTPLGRSVLLLRGVLPVEYDDIVVTEVEPGRRFLERSSTLTAVSWVHERVLEDTGAAGTRLRDSVHVRLRAALRRAPGSDRLVRSAVSALFEHRHRRLRQHFGTVG